MITKEALERLRSERPQRKTELHYTIGGAIEAQVHSSLEAERIGKINRGDRAMNKAVQDFRHNMAFKSRAGQAKAQFESISTHLPLHERQR